MPHGYVGYAAMSCDNLRAALGKTGDGSPAPTGHFADYTSVEDPFQTPEARQAFALLSLPQPGEAPTANMYIYHSIVDELIPIEGTDRLVAAWCAAGTTIAYNRSPLGEHVGLVATEAPGAILYLQSRFAGLPVTITPPTATTCN